MDFMLSWRRSRVFELVKKLLHCLLSTVNCVKLFTFGLTFATFWRKHFVFALEFTGLYFLFHFGDWTSFRYGKKVNERFGPFWSEDLVIKLRLRRCGFVLEIRKSSSLVFFIGVKNTS